MVSAQGARMEGNATEFEGGGAFGTERVEQSVEAFEQRIKLGKGVEI